MNGKDYLFVYGTLRDGYDLKLKDDLSDELEYVGKGRIGASLYDIGKYPGAIKDKTGNEVIGDVFLVNNPDKVFRVLDKYEGYSKNKAEESEFVRKRNRVTLNSGKNMNVWVYWYNQDPNGRAKIRYKDYLKYLKRRKS